MILLMRKDIHVYVNEPKRLFNFKLRHKLKEQQIYFCVTFHSNSLQ